jgi:hypothetical protein
MLQPANRPPPFFAATPIEPYDTEYVVEEGMVDKRPVEIIDGGQGIVARNDVCDGA